MEETIAVPISEYKRLLDSSIKLRCLEAGGVDNWEWYTESLEEGGYFEETK